MCGIVGAVANHNHVSAVLLEGLKRLEYRGYDSAGMVLVDEPEHFAYARALGKVSKLADKLKETPLLGHCGIAHTRWATHGVPASHNAHPHLSSDTIAVVHNGIIENFQELKQRLTDLGYAFVSETDTEVIAHLLHHHLQQSETMMCAMQKLVDELDGSYALGIINNQQPHYLYAIRQGSPLVVGLGGDGNYLASDPVALAKVADEFIYLEEGDMAVIGQEAIQLFDAKGEQVIRSTAKVSGLLDMADKGEYRHFMRKEIFEQPQALAATLSDRVDENQVFIRMFGEAAQTIFEQTKQIQIVACGTSYHAGLVGKYWIESLAGIPTQVEIASEYRYRQKAISDDTLFITISQSGETADTLAALSQAKGLPYLSTLGICNVSHSSLVRESALVALTRAGVEIGVASTKAFTTQLQVLLLLALGLSQLKQSQSSKRTSLMKQLMKTPNWCEELLAKEEEIAEMAKQFIDKSHTLFLGRGEHYPIAKEGALKLKELSYIHAEAYPAGELKHGPLALVDKDMPVVAIIAKDDLLDKMKANLEEVSARGGQLFLFVDEGVSLGNLDAHVIRLPHVPSFLAPICYTIALQLLSYHVAVLKGTDVDQPRNLAKSVTVE